jgi:alkanesulfonate monooxygenase SsuD/methylene tetrahydromethanopterin reductase-like flavin-dependent oxidoreductase (luciferase family)
LAVQYCLNLPTGGVCGDARILAEFATLAEAAGWDGVFLEDYIVYQNRQDIPTYDPWIALAAMALQTRRLRLGTMVTPLARRRPWKVAREAVTLDHLSDGRLILGVGVGDSADVSLTHFGETTEINLRAGMLDEALDVLVGLWSGQPFSYAGTHYRVQEVTCLPRPLQAPRIPIWVGGAYPNRGPMRRAARWDGACLYKATAVGSAEDSGEGLMPHEIAALKRFVEGRRSTSTPFDIAVGGPRPGVDVEQERERIRASAAAGATWCMGWIPPEEPAVMRTRIARGPLRID